MSVVPEGTGHARDEAPAPRVDDIDLLAYVATGWKYRYVLAAVVLLGLGATYLVVRQVPPTYEARFRLLVTEPRLDERQSVSSITTFKELLESSSLANTVLGEFKLTAPPYNFTAQRFLDGNMDVEVVRDAPLLSVSMRLTDPALLVKLANRYAEMAVELAQRLTSEDVVYTRDRIQHEAEDARARLLQARTALEQYQQRTQIEVLRKDADTMLMRRPEALDLIVRIEGERARLRQAEAELAGQEQVRSVPRALSSVAPITGAAAGPENTLKADEGPLEREARETQAGGRGMADRAAANAAEDASGLPAAASAERRDAARRAADDSEPRTEMNFRTELLNPYINPVYEVLQRDVADRRARLAGLERQRRELVQRLRLDQPTAERLNKLYKAETGLDAVEAEVELARVAYISAASKYDEARLQSALRSPRLQLLDPALPPERPVSPRVLRTLAVAGLLALTIGWVAVIAFDASRRRRAA